MHKHFYAQLELPPSQNRPFVALNMVASLDGKVTSRGRLDPGSLGSTFDRKTMNVIRSHFDAVLAGGNTIRQHPYYLGVPKELEVKRRERGLAAQPLTVLLTKSGQLDPLGPVFATPPRPPVIITTTKGAKNLPTPIKEVAIVEILGEQQGPQAICQLLWEEHQVSHLLVEGGPSVNYQFCQDRHVDQIFFTLAPRIVGASNDLTMIMGPKVLPTANQINLLSMNKHGDELFLRYEINW